MRALQRCLEQHRVNEKILDLNCGILLAYRTRLSILCMHTAATQ